MRNSPRINIKKQSIGEVGAVLGAIVKLLEYINNAIISFKKFRADRKLRKEYKRAEKLKRKKDVKKINEILKG